MRTKKSIIKNIFFSTVILAVGLGVVSFVLAQTCPENTTVGETEANLVGEITDDGGDPNLEVWLQYGQTTDYGSETTHSSQQGIGPFCATVTNLNPCTSYHFQAVGKNSAGTNYGEDKSFTTKCTPTLDLKANDSDGPITLDYGDSVTLSWDSTNASSCTASGDWSGEKTADGSETIQLDSVKTWTFTLTCQAITGDQTAEDSVEVTVNPIPPTVITKPAVVTL